MNVQAVEADWSDPAHCRGLLDVLDCYARGSTGGGKPLSPEVRQRLIPALRSQSTALVLLALDDGQVVGVAVCFFGLSTFQARPLLNIHDLAVLPDYRGKGVGRALLDAVEARARQRGCCKLTLEVLDDNAPARRLYERCGFSDPVVGRPTATCFLTKPLG